MLHLRAGSPGMLMRGLQLEIPLGGPIGIIDQHEMRIVLQTFSLDFHGAAILLHEFCKDKFHVEYVIDVEKIDKKNSVIDFTDSANQKLISFLIWVSFFLVDFVYTRLLLG